MFSRTLGYIFSSLVIACTAVPACAQQEDELVVDTTARRFIPTGVRFGTDLLALGMSQFTEGFDAWEIAADVDFYRYYLVAEFGNWSSFDAVKNGYYSNDGTYFRVGADINFLHKDPDRNMFFLGGRFGRSTFSDEAVYSYDVPGFPTTLTTVSNPHVIGTWVELTAGLKVKIWSIFWLGATGRMKFGLDLDGNGELTSYDVPGYGRTFRTTWWGFNYYALVKIPFRTQK